MKGMDTDCGAMIVVVINNNLYKYNLFCLVSIGGMLSIADLNLIVKYYAARIQQRIEQLHHFAVFPHTPPDQQDCEFISLIAKYADYTTHDDKELKLAKKLAERVVQIFEFFRAKSNSQNLLGVIQARIQKEMQEIVLVVPLKLGELFSYIHLLTRRGCVVRPPAEKKRIISRPLLSRETRGEERAPTFSFFNIQKRAISAVASNKHLRASVNPAPTAPATAEKVKAEDIVLLLTGMDLDRCHLARLKDNNQQLLLKEALRRNQRFMIAMRKQEKRKNKRAVTDFSEECAILTEVKTNALKSVWTKKRRPGPVSRKKHNSIKQNVSLID